MKKYNEETKSIGFRVPISEISNVRNLVYNYLNGKIQKNLSKDDIEIEMFSSDSINSKMATKQIRNDHSATLHYKCGCTYSKNLFQRKKGCGLTKVQHTES